MGLRHTCMCVSFAVGHGCGRAAGVAQAYMQVFANVEEPEEGVEFAPNSVRAGQFIDVIQL